MISRPPSRRHSGSQFAAALVVLVGGFALPAAAGAQPRGDVRLWAEERYETWGPFGEVRDWDGARLHADGRFTPVNAGVWTFWFDAARTGQELRMVADNVPSRAGRFSFQLGDFVVGEPGQNTLLTEFQQPLWLRGGSAALARNRVSFGVHAGTLTERQSVFGWGRAPLYEPAYGATVSGSWNKNGLWKADWNRQEDAPGFEGGLHQFSAYGGFTPPEGWSWQSQLRASREDGSGIWGGSALAGGGYARGPFQGFAHLRRFSPDFRGLGLYPDPHQNEWGWRIESSYRPRPQVLVGTSWDWGKDLEPRANHTLREQRLTTRFFASTSIGGPFLVRGVLGYRNRTTEDPESLLVDQGAISWEGALGWNTPRSQVEATLTRTLIRDPLSLRGDWNEDRVGAHGQHRLGERWRGEFRGWTVNRRFLDGTWASRERKLELSGNWEPHSRERAWLSVGRQHQDASDASYLRDQWEIGMGYERPLPWDLSLEIESLFFLRASSLEADRTRVNLRVTRSFAFGGGGPGFQERLPEFGKISGQVYEDLNGDGSRQVGEQGLAAQVLSLSDGRTVLTDAAGRYLVDRALTGYESVTLDVARLPTRFLAPALPSTVYSLRPGDEVVRDFPIRPAAALAGRVMIDRGTRAEGVPDVLLRVRGTHQDVFTDAQGRFYIPGLDPGQVTIEVVGWSLPEDSEPEGPMSRTMRLRAGRPVNVGIFVLRPKGPNVIQFFRPEGDGGGGEK